MTARLDTQRNTALSAIDRQQTLARLAMFGAIAVEGLLLAAILFVIDFHDHTQRIVFLSAMMVYMPLAIGLMALAAMINRHSRMILHGLQMIGEERS